MVLKHEEGRQIRRSPTRNMVDDDILLRTRSSMWPPTRENLLTARSAYQRITEIDPSFAGGHAGQSMTYSFAVVFGLSEDPQEDARFALDLANAALVLDNSFAQGYSALGLALTATGQHKDCLLYTSPSPRD